LLDLISRIGIMNVPPYQGDDIPRNEIKSVDASRDELSVDSDAARLAEMGYTQEMERGFSKWTLLGGEPSVPPFPKLL
jgi:choline transport protein